MKILLITEVFPPRNGGSGRWFWEVYRRLDAGSTRIIAGCFDGDDAFDSTHPLSVTRTPMSFPTWGVASRTGLGCYRQLVATLRQEAAQFGPDQIHCGKILPEGLAAHWIWRKTGIPYLVYVHGEELSIAGASKELKWLTRRVFRSAETVIANSHNTASLLREDWGVSDSQLRVLHPGVDIERFQPASRDPEKRNRLGWDGRQVVLTVGRLQKRKGHDQLIRAIPALRETFPDFLYSIVGDGPERQALQGLVESLNLGDSVEFRGESSDEEMLECYQQCDLFALPNRLVDGDFEGFGMVLLEAQACGKPVVAGASGGTGEAMEDGVTGVRVDCDSVEGLGIAIGQLLEQSSSHRPWFEDSRRFAVERFSWEAIVNTALEIYGATPAGVSN